MIAYQAPLYSMNEERLVIKAKAAVPSKKLSGILICQYIVVDL